MKKAISIFLMICLLLSLTACRKTEEELSFGEVDEGAFSPIKKTPVKTEETDTPPSEVKTPEVSQQPDEPVAPAVTEDPDEPVEEPYPTIKEPTVDSKESGHFFIFQEGLPALQDASSEVFSSVVTENGETVTVYDPDKFICEETRWDRYVHPEKTDAPIGNLEKYQQIVKGDGLIVAGVLEGNREGHYRKIDEFPFDDVYTVSNLRVEHVFCGDAKAGDVLQITEDYYLVKEKNQPMYYYTHDFTTGYVEPLNNGELRLFFLEESPRGDNFYVYALDSYWLNEDYLDYSNRELERYLDLICRDPDEPKIPFWSETTTFHPDGTISRICADGYYGDTRPREEVLEELKTYQVYVNVMLDFKVEIPYENLEK